MIGQRFGRLVVTARDGRRVTCSCDCGKTIEAERGNVAYGRTRSCGCLQAEVARENGRRAAKHGHTSGGKMSPEYLSWQAMNARCRNPAAENFAEYGGRGITVCGRWRESFAAFLADVGPRRPGTTLDRVQNDGNYEPGNVRWATPRQQAGNRRTSRLITIGGETACLTEWARRAGVSDHCILHRLRRGLTGRALIQPAHHGKPLLNAAAGRIA